MAIALFAEWGYLCIKNQLPLGRKIITIFLGTVYLAVSTLWLFETLYLSEGWKLIFWLLFLVWSADTAAYVVGKILKGPKLIPVISPNKTWAGLFGALLIGTGVSYETSFWLFPEVFTLGGIALIVFISQVGDLLESLAKRLSDVKDTSFLIPGHGGVLDRLDSLLAVSFALALWGMLTL